MTLNTSSTFWRKLGLYVLTPIGALLLWNYLAGQIFLQIYSGNSDDASLITLYQYYYYYGSNHDVQKWLVLACILSAVFVGLMLKLVYTASRRSLYGEARFATDKEVKRSGLQGEDGIIVGKYKKKYLMFSGTQHVILSAPTRSGKGVGIVIPNLLNWPDSVVVLDIKKENWDYTSGFRAKYGQDCYIFDPVATNYRTHRYNPLSYISTDPNFRIDDVQKIANMFFPDVPGTDVIWTATPRSLFLGVVLFLLESPGKVVTLGQVLRETLVDGDASEYFKRSIAERASSGNPLSMTCVNALNSYCSIASDNTRSGVMTSFRSRLELWANPIVDAATSANDFDLGAVRKRRMSIYIGATPDNLDRLGPLINLLFQQLIDQNTRKLPHQDKDIKYKCLLLMDEFTAIGKIPILAKGISFIAGYWLRMMPIIQSPAQTVEVYGEAAAETFTTNHALQIIYPPKASELKTARDISEWLGYETVDGVSVSKSRHFGKKEPTESISDQRRALLLPQEITSLPEDVQLVVAERILPIVAHKIKYYADDIFIDRLKEVSPTLRKLGSKLPTQNQLESVAHSGELAADVHLLDMESHAHSVAASMAILFASTTTPPIAVTQRDATPSDIESMATRALQGFAVDFSGITPPKVGTLDVAALEAYADAHCEAAGIPTN